MLPAHEFRPHIVHSHDWHAAFAPLWLRSNYKNDPVFAGTKSVMTIHNIGYQGEFSAADVADLDLGADAYLLHQDDLKAGRINALKHGILHADAVTTVSPTYAREITTPRYGMGMEQALAARGSAVHGILNGVDYEEWDPAHDKHLPIHFGPCHHREQGRAQAQFPAATGHDADSGPRADVRHREPARIAEGLRPADRHAAEAPGQQ
jgi:starch synthase